MTGDTLRSAIAAACDLTNPRLSEVDWDSVAASFDEPLPPDTREEGLREAAEALVNGVYGLAYGTVSGPDHKAEDFTYYVSGEALARLRAALASSPRPGLDEHRDAQRRVAGVPERPSGRTRGGDVTPRTEAGKNLLLSFAGPWNNVPRSIIESYLPRIEAEAIAARDAEIRAGVSNLWEASHQRVGPNGWRHVNRDSVFALLLRQAEPPETNE